MIISLKEINVEIDNKKILSDINIELHEGKIYTILGNNGSGKSSLLKTICGLIKPVSGSVNIDENNILKLSRKNLAKMFAYLGQKNIVPSDMTVIELVSYGRHPHKKYLDILTDKDHEIINDAMDKCSVSDFAARRISTLSGGELQRVWLAMTLSQEPKVMLLDEPSTYLDLFHQQELLSLLKEINKALGITIICVLHDINQAMRISDEIILLRNGQIIKKGPGSEVLDLKNIEITFDIEMSQVGEKEYQKYFLPKSYFY